MKKTFNSVVLLGLSVLIPLTLGINNAYAQVSSKTITRGQSSNHISPAISSNTTPSIGIPSHNKTVKVPSMPRSIIGEWIPPDRDVVIRIHHCSGEAIDMSICAELVRHAYSNLSTTDVLNPDPTLRNRPLTGVDILANLKAKGRDKWTGGKLYDPRTGKSYFPKLKLLGPDTLKLTGCIGPGLCKGYIWERATKDVMLVAQDIHKLQEINTDSR